MTRQKKNSGTVSHLRTNGRGSSIALDPNIGLDHIDVAALAQLYNSPPASHIARQDLLDQARLALMKYELAEDELAIASDSLARSMHMLIEQHGLKQLEPKQMAELERDVINWCGLNRCEPIMLKTAQKKKIAALSMPLITQSRNSAHGTTNTY